MFAIRLASSLRLTKLFPKIKSASISAFGLTFNAPFGLAAGFDKNAVAVRALGELGFSHVEIGTVTAIAQDGNDKPSLFRLKADRALINRMGFNNDGAVNAADLSLLLGAWGASGGAADLNGDGTVGAADLALLLGGWTG
jgi:hypothetical protein